MKAYVFPGQGAQYVGMGKSLYDRHPATRNLFERADEILGFQITKTMFEGTDEELRETRVTQPAVYLYSVAVAMSLGDDFRPDMVGGHSLGEFSALTAAGCLNFEDGLRLVSARAHAMQKACQQKPGTMAAIIGLDDATVEAACAEAANVGIVVAANYNCPGQLVISGEMDAVGAAVEILKEKGAKRALMLPVSGAFHSPLMLSAKEELEEAISKTVFHEPKCPVYQNFDGKPHTDIDEIKKNLISQLTGSVRWTEEVRNMISFGADWFMECGPGRALQGMLTKITRSISKEAVILGADS